MSVVLVGMSYRCAPISLLERIAVQPQDRPGVARELLSVPYISESLIISTCNRTEFYVACDGFHPTVEHIVDVISRYSDTPVADLLPHLYVRYAEAAAEHMLRVAAGLDSMVVGEQQIIGQIREAYAAATEQNTVGHILHELTRRALRTGKRVHTETSIDDEAPSMVSFALEQAIARIGVTDLDGRHALVIGAGAMSALAATHLGRLGASLTIANRTLERAEGVVDHAHQAGVEAWATDLSDLVGDMAAADIVVSATGALDPIITTDMVERALAAKNLTAKRQHGSAALVICDLSMPRDVAIAPMDGVELFNIERLQALRQELDGIIAEDPAASSPAAGLTRGSDGTLSCTSTNCTNGSECCSTSEGTNAAGVGDSPAATASSPATEAAHTAAARARAIVAEELHQHLAKERSLDVVPTVKALRTKATEILTAEIERLDSRTPDLSERERDEIHRAMKRVVDKLMHTPTVRLKQMAGQTDVSYSSAVRTLFGLAPGTVSGLYSSGNPGEDTPATSTNAQGNSSASTSGSRSVAPFSVPSALPQGHDAA